jgi:hypothetical protein
MNMTESAEQRIEHDLRAEAQAPAIYASMVAIAKALASAGLGKDSKNAFHGYKYRGIDAVCDAVGPLLALHDVCLVCWYSDMTVEEGRTKKDEPQLWVRMKGTFEFISARDGSKMKTGAFYGEAADTGDKGVGKAESYAYRNMLIKTFCIPVNGAEADTEAHEPEPRKAVPKVAPAPQQSKGGITKQQSAEMLHLVGGLEHVGTLSALCLSRFQRKGSELSFDQAEEILAELRGTNGNA